MKDEIYAKMQALERELSKPVATPEDAERTARAAALLAEGLRWAERVDHLLGPQQREGSADGPTSLAGLPLNRAARQVLAEAGTPLHVTELGRRIKVGGWTHPRSRNARHDQINFQLAARLPREPHIFRRVSPNTFALVEWDANPPVARAQPRLGIISGRGKPAASEIHRSDAPFSKGDKWRSS